MARNEEFNRKERIGRKKLELESKFETNSNG